MFSSIRHVDSNCEKLIYEVIKLDDTISLT